MILALDVGNTETVIGLFERSELLEHWRLSTHPARTTDELGLLLRALIRESGFDPDSVDAAAVASVVPPLTRIFAAATAQHLGARVHTIEATSQLPVRLDVDEPLSVGPDRIVNTLAAFQLFHTDTIVVDFGTATTFDCITAAGVFVGGVITPGLTTSAESLVRRTAVLPSVDLVPPLTVIGRRTDTAIRSGVLYGAIDAVDGIVRRIRAEWQPRALVVATGGLAEAISPHCATIERVEPHITLYGLMFALRHLERQAAQRQR